MTARYTRLEQHWFGALVFYTVAPLLVVSAGYRPRAIDFWWDFAMALGILAAAGLTLLPLLSARWWAPRHRATGFLRLVQAAHRQLAYVLIGLSMVHVGILWGLEPRVIEYLKPGAVAPMLAGTGALLLAVFVTLTSRYRDALHWRYASWRGWHAVLSLGMLVLLGWHLLGAGYYFAVASAVAAAVWLIGVPTLTTWGLRLWPMPPLQRISGAPPAVTEAARWRAPRLVLAVTLTWVMGAIGFAWSGQWQAPPRERALCAVDPCL